MNATIERRLRTLEQQLAPKSLANDHVRPLSRPLRVRTVAELLGCTERKVRTLLTRGALGELPPKGLRGFRVGRSWRVPPEAVVAFRERQG